MINIDYFHSLERVRLPIATYRIEAIVDQMLQILAHANLSHQFVFVTIHAGQLTHMGEDVLQTVGQLKSVHVV